MYDVTMNKQNENKIKFTKKEKEKNEKSYILF